MPFVNVKILKGLVNKEQKAQIVQEITNTLVRILNKKPEYAHIVIDEVDLDNWGFAGQLFSEYEKK